MSDLPLELRLRRIHQRHRLAMVRRIVTAGLWTGVLLTMAGLVVGMAIGFVQK